MDEHVEGVAAGAVVSFNLSARVTYAFNTPHPTQQVHLELPLHYLRRVDAERLRHTVGIVQGEHGIASHIAVAVVEILLDGLHQRLQQLKLLQLGHEAQRAAAHKLVGVHEVLAQEVAHEDHLLAQFAGGSVGLVHGLEIDVAAGAGRARERGGGGGVEGCVHKLLELVVVERHAVADDLHQCPTAVVTVDAANNSRQLLHTTLRACRAHLLRMRRLTAAFLTAPSFCSMSLRKSPLSSLSAALLSLGMRMVH